MTTITLQDNIARQLKNLLPGSSLAQKISLLMRKNAMSEIENCEREIVNFELKHGKNFEEFKSWLKQQPDDIQHSHELERDFMEWEGWLDEKQGWLDRLKEFDLKQAHADQQFSTAN